MVMGQVDSSNFYPISTGGDEIRFDGVWNHYPTSTQQTWFYTIVSSPDNPSYLACTSIDFPTAIIVDNFYGGGTWTTKTSRTPRSYVVISGDSMVVNKPIPPGTSLKFYFIINENLLIKKQKVITLWDDSDNPTDIWTDSIWAPSHELLSGGALPIHLVSFQAKLIDNNNNVTLDWTTASEINNNFFTIEKSTNLTSWDEVNRVYSMGNSNTFVNYSCLDDLTSQQDPIIYYRLSQTDYDGNTKVYNTNIVSVLINKEQQYINKKILLFDGAKFRIRISDNYDVNGRMIDH
jgi:hypothetical protein